MLSKEIQDAIEMFRKQKEASKGRAITPEGALEARKNIDNILGNRPNGKGITVEEVRTPRVTGEFYHYDESDPDKLKGKVLLYIHGGGFMTGSVLSRRKNCHNLLEQARMDAFSVEYGQWPEAEHPRGLDDCVAAYRWLRGKGYEGKDIYFYGGSAGAMLTLTSILYLKDHGEELPGKALVFSPVAGQDMDLPSHTELDDRDPMISYEPVIPYYEKADFTSPYVSPGYGDYRGFPELAIHAGSEEVLLDDAKLIYSLCEKAGVKVSLKIWEGLFHVFTLVDSPESEEATREFARFFRNEDNV